MMKALENVIEGQENVEEAQWNKHLWLQQCYPEKTFRFGNYVLWFPKEAKEKVGKFTMHWYGTYHIQYCLFNNIVLLVTSGNVEPHPILVNVNKLKPCMYVE